MIRVQTDHANLRYFFKTKRLNNRQARWTELLAAYDFEIEYRPGHLNAADAPSRRADYVPTGATESQIGLLPTLQKKLKLGAFHSQLLEGLDHPSSARRGRDEANRRRDVVESTGSLAPRLLLMEAASREDPYLSPATDVIRVIARLQQGDAFARKQVAGIKSGAKIGKSPKRWRVGSDELLRRDESIYVPKDKAVMQELLRVHHDDPFAGHFSEARTLELLQRKYYWKAMGKDVSKYVETCDICQRIRTPRHKQYGELASLPIPSRPGESLSIDFITALPPSKLREKEYNAILVIVDRYTKMAHYIPTTSTIDAEELADEFTEHILTKYGAPKSIISDRGSLFTSHFWLELYKKFRIKYQLSTAFHL